MNKVISALYFVVYSGEQCHPGGWWGDVVHLPDWVVAVAAAIGGSMIGVVIGFLLYKCCCRR